MLIDVPLNNPAPFKTEFRHGIFSPTSSVYTDQNSRLFEQKVAFALKQAELCTSQPEICRKLGISGATYCAGCISKGEGCLENCNIFSRPKRTFTPQEDDCLTEPQCGIAAGRNVRQELMQARLHDGTGILRDHRERRFCFAPQLSSSMNRYLSVTAVISVQRLPFRKIPRTHVNPVHRRAHVLMRRKG